MAFEKGNKLGQGRPKGSRNKANILSDAMDKALKKDVGSAEGAELLFESLITDLYSKIQNRSLDVSDLTNLIKTFAPYFGSKHMSQKSEVTKHDTSVSTKMVQEVNELKMQNQKLMAELKEEKRKKHGGLKAL